MQSTDVFPTPPPRLALIDDDADARELFSEFLRFEGFEVKALESAEDALAYLEHARVDAVVTDVTLTGMSGCEAARALRSNAATRRTPIVAVTGLYATDLGEDRNLFDAVLVKPVDPSRLVATVRALLEGVALPP